MPSLDVFRTCLGRPSVSREGCGGHTGGVIVYKEGSGVHTGGVIVHTLVYSQEGL